MRACLRRARTRCSWSTAATIYVVVFFAFLLLEQRGLGMGDFFSFARRAGLGAGCGCACDRPVHDRRPASTTRCRRARSSRSPRRSGSSTTSRSGRCSAGSRRTTARRMPTCRSSRSATWSPGCRIRGRSSSRSTAGSPGSRSRCSSATCRLAALVTDHRDDALRRVSDALYDELGPEADVARVGGEEFAVQPVRVRRAGRLSWPVPARADLCENGFVASRIRLVRVPARGRERADPLPRRRRAAVRAPRPPRAPPSASPAFQP